MMNNKNILYLFYCFFGIILFVICLIGFLFDISIALPIIVYVCFVVLFFFLMHQYQKEKKAKIIDINKTIAEEINDALIYGEVGLVVCDNNFIITWMNDFLLNQNINFIGQKITQCLPETKLIFDGEQDEITLEYADHFYKVSRKQDSAMLFFVDITQTHLLEKDYRENSIVLGLIHLDNYEEAIEYEEETQISILDSEIRQPIIQWAIDHQMIIKKIKNDRYLIVLNQKTYQTIVMENFDIMDEVRNKTQKYPILITLSMAFAYGTNDYFVLDEMLNSLLQLAQARGGDQVASRCKNEDIIYYGGKSEAQEKTSKTKVRVIAHSLAELIDQAHNVIIIGHKTMDFDAMGAAILMSRIVQSHNKVASIVYDIFDLEAKLRQTYEKYEENLCERNHFVSKEEAYDLLDDSTLVILVDHHELSQTLAPEIIKDGKKIVVIDHHRRKSDFEFTPLLSYIEASASSVTEMLTELIMYQKQNFNISENEATLMYTGILIDTTSFKNRTGVRTFEAAAELRKLGADPLIANDLIKEDYEVFELKAQITKNCEYLDHNVVIATYDKDKATRAIISQVANELLDISEVEASFVIAKIDDVICASARSNGKINVQVIFEKLQGGGHFTQAGLQRVNTSVDEIKNELLIALEEYFEEVIE